MTKKKKKVDEEVKERPLIKNLNVLGDVSIVKIRTIKEKHFMSIHNPLGRTDFCICEDDSKQTPIQLRNDVDVLGIHAGHVIFRNINTEAIFKIHMNDMADVFRELLLIEWGNNEVAEAHQAAIKMINEYPQIFED
jgi:hypothetical protein